MSSKDQQNSVFEKKNELLSSNNSFQKLPLTSNHLQLCQRNVLFNRKGEKGGIFQTVFFLFGKKRRFRLPCAGVPLIWTCVCVFVCLREHAVNSCAMSIR